MGKTLKANNLLRHIAIIGNLSYILWMLHNGIDEGFKVTGHIVEVISIIGLIFLLILNIVLLYHSRNI